jgi:hypothetical protein
VVVGWMTSAEAVEKLAEAYTMPGVERRAF